MLLKFCEAQITCKQNTEILLLVYLVIPIIWTKETICDIMAGIINMTNNEYLNTQ